MTAAARTALGSIAAETDWRADRSRVTFAPGDSGVPIPLPISDIAAGAYGALALAAAELQEARGGGVLTPTVDRRRAGFAMMGNVFLTVNGEAPQSWDPLTGHHRCGDGDWVYLHANFPHHRDGLLALFDARNDRAAMIDALAAWSAAEAEEAAQTRGLCAMMLPRQGRMGGASAARSAGDAPLAGDPP